jgi:hypothetical protein
VSGGEAPCLWQPCWDAGYIPVLLHCFLPYHRRLRLSATCTGLRQASLAWFPQVTVFVRPGKIDAVSLAAWLERHQGEVSIARDVADWLRFASCAGRGEALGLMLTHCFAEKLSLCAAPCSPARPPLARSSFFARRLELGVQHNLGPSSSLGQLFIL